MIIMVCLGFVLVFSNKQLVEAIGLPPTQVVKLQTNYNHRYEIKFAPTVNWRLDKIIMLSTNKMISLIYFNGHYCYDHLLKKLRASELSKTLNLYCIRVVIYIMYQDQV